MHYWEEIQELISFKCARKCMISYVKYLNFPRGNTKGPRGGMRRPPPAPTPSIGGKHLPDQGTHHLLVPPPNSEHKSAPVPVVIKPALFSAPSLDDNVQICMYSTFRTAKMSWRIRLENVLQNVGTSSARFRTLKRYVTIDY